MEERKGTRRRGEVDRKAGWNERSKYIVYMYDDVRCIVHM